MLNKIYIVCKIMNSILDRIITLLIIVIIFFSFLGLYNIFSVVSNAPLSKSIQKFKSGETESNPNIKELMLLYPDVTSWLRIKDTNIDYPVVQGDDNSEYLNKTVEGEYSLSGSIFLDSRNDPTFESKYSLLYGHYLIGNLMFGGLHKYKNKEYFNLHKSGYLYLKDKTYIIDIFACMQTKAYDKKIFYPLWIVDEPTKLSVISYIKNNAINYSDIDFTEKDKIIALSTCDSATTDGRFVVFGRLRDSDFQEDQKSTV